MKRWIAVMSVVLLLLAAMARAADLGKTTVLLDGQRVGSAETNYGNFVADAVRHASGANIAILHSMAFRAGALIPKGVVDEQAIRGSIASPSSNIVILELTSAQLRALMVRALTKYPEPNTAFLQISGMVVTFDSEQPVAMRVISINVAGHAIDFSDTKTIFKVAMPRELASGAAGYLIEFTDEVTKTLQKTNLTLYDAITREFQRQDGSISPNIEGRLRDLKDRRAR